MKRSEVYDALRAWLQSHGFDADYRVQYRFWNELQGTEAERYFIIQQNGGGATEEAITRDYFRFLLLSGQNDSSINEIEDRAEAIRQTMIDDFHTDCLVSMRPVGGIVAVKTAEGRFMFEVNFQTIISRSPA